MRMSSAQNSLPLVTTHHIFLTPTSIKHWNHTPTYTQVDIQAHKTFKLYVLFIWGFHMWIYARCQNICIILSFGFCSFRKYFIKIILNKMYIVHCTHTHTLTNMYEYLLIKITAPSSYTQTLYTNNITSYHIVYVSIWFYSGKYWSSFFINKHWCAFLYIHFIKLSQRSYTWF